MASYNMNTFENGDLVINQIDPDFECGELEGITKEDVEDDWIENNFSGVTKEELEGTGIKVDFVPGESEYTINGEVVTEEEYKNYENDPYMAINNTTDNTTTLKSYDEFGAGGMGSWDTIGNSIENPGHLEITIPQELVEGLLSNDVKLTPEAVDKLNSWTGTDVFNTAMGLKDSKDLMDELLKNGFKSPSVWLLLASMGLEPILNAVGLKGFWDADENERVKMLNRMAKAGELVAIIEGLGALLTGGSGVLLIGVIGLVSAAVDKMILDGGDIDLFQYDEKTDTLKWEVGLKNSDGATITYSGGKKINYEEPDKLYNRIGMYLETARIDMNRTLNKLIQRREVIIKEVKKEINAEMEEPKETSKLKELAYMYNIDYWDYHYGFPQASYTGSQPNFSTTAPHSSGENLTIKYSIDDYVLPLFYVEQKEKTSSDENISTFIEPDKYDTSKDYHKILVLRTTEKNYVFDYESFSDNLVNSYYEYYRNQQNNIDFKNNFINKITEDDIVHTGEVDLWHGLEFFDKDEKVFGYGEYSMNVNSEGIEESHKNKTNFISIERIKLAQQMMNQLYSDIMVILEEYITLGDDFKELDGNISDQIKSVWE